MPSRKINLIEGEYYHIYNRGNSKQKIFKDRNDYQRFLKLLYLSNSEQSFTIRDVGKEVYSFDRKKPLVGIGAYCLMPNHFHILITQLNDGGISKFMQKLTTGYSMYYNQKYKRTGTLFEGKFKSEYANKDNYLKYLFSYIHLNPIKLIDPKWKESGIKNKKTALGFLNTYLFSSYIDYLDFKRAESVILNNNAFPKYFPNKEDFEKEILDWINYKSTTEERPLELI